MVKKAEINRKFFDDITKKLTDEGKLIGAGFIGFSIAFIPKDAPAEQVLSYRTAFMAGAQHLFASLMGILDPGAEPTEDDMRRMSLINKELQDFTEEFKRMMSMDN
jgi:hypothetical protein